MPDRAELVRLLTHTERDVRVRAARELWFGLPAKLRDARWLPDGMAVCPDSGPTLLCPLHGCPACWMHDPDEWCEGCAAALVSPYPDPLCRWQDDCLTCGVCLRCTCRVPVCRECQRCVDHIEERGLDRAELLELAADFQLCWHVWLDPATGRWVCAADMAATS